MSELPFQVVTKTSAIPAGSGKLFVVEGHRVALFNLNGEFYAIDDICTHEEASLSDGAIDGETVECPWHGALFNIKSGAALTMPAVTPVRTYAVKVDGDQVLVDVSTEASMRAGA